jgi:hypothetical protein
MMTRHYQSRFGKGVSRFSGSLSKIGVNKSILEIALTKRQYYVFRLLLSASQTDLNSKDKLGRTLLYAVEDTNPVAVQMLLTRDDVDLEHFDL